MFARSMAVNSSNPFSRKVRGDSAVYLVNGKVNMRLSNMKKWDAASNSWQKLDRGKILFQAEYAEISYRNIKIRPVQEADPK